MNLQRALDLMPQKGPMLLIDKVLKADETSISCRARDHRCPNYPLRIAGQLMPAALTELGAQASAAHSALFGGGGRHTGLLLSIRHIDVLRPNKAPLNNPLTAYAEQLHSDDYCAKYRFSVRDKYGYILRGETMFMIRTLGA